MMACRSAARRNLMAADADVGHLEAHADGEREVGEVEVHRGDAAGELEAADSLGVFAVVEMRVAEGERDVRHRPRETDGHEAKRGSRSREPRRQRVRVSHEQRCAEQADRRRQDDDYVDERATGVFGACAFPRCLRVGAGDPSPGEGHQRHGEGVPGHESRGRRREAAEEGDVRGHSGGQRDRDSHDGAARVDRGRVPRAHHLREYAKGGDRRARSQTRAIAFRVRTQNRPASKALMNMRPAVRPHHKPRAP